MARLFFSSPQVKTMSAQILCEQRSPPTNDPVGRRSSSEQLINSSADQRATDGHKRGVPTTRTSGFAGGVEGGLKGEGGVEGEEGGEGGGGRKEAGYTAPQDDDARRRSEVLVIRKKLFASMVESATGTARLLTDNFVGEAGSHERCLELFERLRRDAVALSGGAGPSRVLAGTSNQPTAVSETSGRAGSLDDSFYGAGACSSGNKRKVVSADGDGVRVGLAPRVHRVRV